MRRGSVSRGALARHHCSNKALSLRIWGEFGSASGFSRFLLGDSACASLHKDKLKSIQVAEMSAPLCSVSCI